MRLSVVIAAWQEASCIQSAVANAKEFADEVVVADAGSADGTAKLAAAAGAHVVAAPRGRGQQLHAGALVAGGDVILFLHADATIDPACKQRIEQALAVPGIIGGNCRLRFTPPTWAARLFGWANHVRRVCFKIYYGDSALFVRRAAYFELGGFRAMPLFEDFDFIKRMQRRGRTAYLQDVFVTASARRFAHAPLRTLALWTLLQCLYSCGVPAERLAKLYRDLR